MGSTEWAEHGGLLGSTGRLGAGFDTGPGKEGFDTGFNVGQSKKEVLVWHIIYLYHSPAAESPNRPDYSKVTPKRKDMKRSWHREKSWGEHSPFNHPPCVGISVSPMKGVSQRYICQFEKCVPR